MQEQNPGGVPPTNPPSGPSHNPNPHGQPPVYAPPQGVPQPYPDAPQGQHHVPPPVAPAPPKLPMAALGAGCGAVALMAILGLGAGLYLSGRSAPPAPIVAPAATLPAISETPDDAQTGTQNDALNPASGNAASSGALSATQDTPTSSASQSGTTEAAGEAAGMGGPEPITGSYANQTTLRADTNGDHPMTVYINGRKVADFQDSLTLDISKMVKPGENTVRAVWTQPIGRGGAVHIAYARERNVFGKLLDLYPEEKGLQPGEKSATFFLPSN